MYIFIILLIFSSVFSFIKIITLHNAIESQNFKINNLEKRLKDLYKAFRILKDEKKENKEFKKQEMFSQTTILFEPKVNESVIEKTEFKENTKEKLNEKARKEEIITSTIFDKVDKAQVKSSRLDKNIMDKIKNSTKKRNFFSISNIINSLASLLLLIGIVYLFKYLNDNNMISKLAIVSFAIVFATFLFLLASFIAKKSKKILAQVVYGLSLAVYYISIYQAYWNYKLFSKEICFFLLAIISLFTILFSLRFNYEYSALITLLGSIFLPFVLQVNIESFFSFSVYIIIFAFISSVCFMIRRWRISLFLTAITLYILLFIASQNIFWLTANNKVELVITLNIITLIFVIPDLIIQLLKKERKPASISFSILILISTSFIVLIRNHLDIFSKKEDGIYYLSVFLVYLVFSFLVFRFNKKSKSVYTYLSSALIFIVLAGFSLLNILHFQIFLVVFGFALSFISYKARDLILSKIVNAYNLLSFIYVIIKITDLYRSRSSNDILIVGLISQVFLSLTSYLQSEKIKKTYQIAYIMFFSVFTTIIYTLSLNLEKEKKYIILLLALPVLLAILNLLEQKFACLFKRSLDFFLIIFFVVLLYPIYYVKDIYSMFLFISYSCFAIIIYTINRFSKKDIKSRFLYDLLMLFALMRMSFVNLKFLPLSPKYSFVISIAILLLLNKFYFLKNSLYKKLVNFSLISWTAAAITNYILTALFYRYMNYGLSEFIASALIFVAISICISKLKISKLHKFWIRAALIFGLSQIDFVALNLKIPIITIVWAIYALINMSYSMYKKEQKSIKNSLILIIFVAARFIFIDLSMIEIIWRILISIALGTILLVFSYFIDAIIKKTDKEVIAEKQEKPYKHL